MGNGGTITRADGPSPRDDEIIRLRAEVERLGADNRILADLSATAVHDCQEARAEVERLKAEVSTFKGLVVRYETLLFEFGAMEHAPCFRCGYNGAGYYQPQTHPCAEHHHRLRKT